MGPSFESSARAAHTIEADTWEALERHHSRRDGGRVEAIPRGGAGE
jgi:hypothetical protein